MRPRIAARSRPWAAIRVPARGQFLRGMALELERVANHVGDLGALAGDVGFLPTMSYCGRIRGDVLNLTAALCGNRFGRGMIRPGGVALDIDAATVEQLRAACGRDRRRRPQRDRIALERAFGDGPLRRRRRGALGPLRATGAGGRGRPGVRRGPRRPPRFPLRHLPFHAYPRLHLAHRRRFRPRYVRWLEVQRSLAFIREQLDALPDGQVSRKRIAQTPPFPPLAADHAVVALIEGWRGEIAHVAMTGGDGRFAAYKVVDPSFHNWFGLAMALRGQQVSDFPLCNKSFNLSYCGHDL